MKLKNIIFIALIFGSAGIVQNAWAPPDGEVEPLLRNESSSGSTWRDMTPEEMETNYGKQGNRSIGQVLRSWFHSFTRRYGRTTKPPVTSFGSDVAVTANSSGASGDDGYAVDQEQAVVDNFGLNRGGADDRESLINQLNSNKSNLGVIKTTLFGDVTPTNFRRSNSDPGKITMQFMLPDGKRGAHQFTMQEARDLLESPPEVPARTSFGLPQNEELNTLVGSLNREAPGYNVADPGDPNFTFSNAKVNDNGTVGIDDGSGEYKYKLSPEEAQKILERIREVNESVVLTRNPEYDEYVYDDDDDDEGSRPA